MQGARASAGPAACARGKVRRASDLVNEEGHEYETCGPRPRRAARFLGLGSGVATAARPGNRPGHDRSAQQSYRGDLYADADAVRELVLVGSQETVLVSHSYGGVVITGAALVAPLVRHLVHICGAQLDAGESVTQASGGSPHPQGDGAGPRMILAPAPERTLDADLSPELAAEYSARLTGQTASSFDQPLRAPAGSRSRARTWSAARTTFFLWLSSARWRRTPPTRRRWTPPSNSDGRQPLSSALVPRGPVGRLRGRPLSNPESAAGWRCAWWVSGGRR